MAAIGETAGIGRADQPQIRLMDQGRGVERLPRFLAGELFGGGAAQFVIDQRHELLGRLRIAGLDGVEDASDVGHDGYGPVFAAGRCVAG